MIIKIVIETMVFSRLIHGLAYSSIKPNAYCAF